MRLRIDVGIDADGDRRLDAARCGEAAEQLELRLGLDVEAMDARVESEGELPRRLADAGEDDLFGRNAGGKRAPQLAFRDHVGAGAEPASVAMTAWLEFAFSE